MKNTKLGFLALCGIALLSAAPSFAATSVKITNGGFGQIATKTDQFGVAICNTGAQTVNLPIPATVAVDSVTANLLITTPLNVGQCVYSYLSYGQFNMKPGQTYLVQVAIDPQRTVITNSDSATVYTVTVPVPAVVAPVAVASPLKTLTADANIQFSNPFKIAWKWLGKIYKGF
jgi:hypothetical protein